MSSSVLHYEGTNYLRQRLTLATLSQRPVTISKIRPDEDAPGLKDYEANFIKLLEKLTNGSKIEVNITGTSLYYQPGFLVGGVIEHDSNPRRSLGYYLEPLLMLGPFCKHPLKIQLTGTTHGPDDPSADYYRLSCLPLMKKLLGNDTIELKVLKRGVWPDGGGEVMFSCPIVRKVSPVWLEEIGKVKRIRGIVYSVKTNPGIANRLVTSARGVLNKYLPDVYISTDVNNKNKSGVGSSGYGVVLVSESTEGSHVSHCTEKSSMISTERSHSDTSSSGSVLLSPEDIGHEAAMILIEEIVRSGCVDSGLQVLPLLYMAMSDRDVSKIKLGSPTNYTIQFLRHMKDFYGLLYKLEEDHNDGTVLVTAVGLGYSNINRPSK